jgi:uncharacterized protein YuzE
MKLSLNYSTDAVYIRLRDSQILESEAIAPGIICDFDKNEQIVGLEILQVQHQTPEQLSFMSLSFSEDDKRQLKEILNRLASAL